MAFVFRERDEPDTFGDEEQPEPSICDECRVEFYPDGDESVCEDCLVKVRVPTPGPWQVRELFGGLYIMGPGKECIATVVSAAQSRGRGYEDDANADLLAAAPEMRDLLRRWVRWNDDWSIGVHERLKIVNDARALLEKLP